MVPVIHQVKTNIQYQGAMEVMRPKMTMVTLATQIQIFLPKRSEMRPEQKVPRTKPRNLQIISSYILSQ